MVLTAFLVGLALVLAALVYASSAQSGSGERQALRRRDHRRARGVRGAHRPDGAAARRGGPLEPQPRSSPWSASACRGRGSRCCYRARALAGTHPLAARLPPRLDEHASQRSTSGRTRPGSSSPTSTACGSTRSSRRLTITRLGEGVDERRRLLPLPIARVRNCLTDYRRELEALGATRTLAIATSAVRDAENGEAFLGEIEWSYGFTTRLLEGVRGGGNDVREVSPRAGLRSTRRSSSDIGGGSTELVLALEREALVRRRASTSAACG